MQVGPFGNKAMFNRLGIKHKENVGLQKDHDSLKDAEADEVQERAKRRHLIITNTLCSHSAF